MQEHVEENTPEAHAEGMTPSLPPDHVEIKGRRIKLRVPDSFTVCNEVVMAGAANLHRAAAAALGLCWQERTPSRKERRRRGAEVHTEGALQRPAVNYEASFSPFIFGQQFTDALVKAGVPWPEIYGAGLKAYHLMSERVLTDDDVEDALGNSSRP